MMGQVLIPWPRRNRSPLTAPLPGAVRGGPDRSRVRPSARSGTRRSRQRHRRRHGILRGCQPIRHAVSHRRLQASIQRRFDRAFDRLSRTVEPLPRRPRANEPNRIMTLSNRFQIFLTVERRHGKLASFLRGGAPAAGHLPRVRKRFGDASTAGLVPVALSVIRPARTLVHPLELPVYPKWIPAYANRTLRSG
jgi:hypothetical protein